MTVYDVARLTHAQPSPSPTSQLSIRNALLVGVPVIGIVLDERSGSGSGKNSWTPFTWSISPTSR